MRALQLLSNHRWLKAIRTSFVLLMPVIFIGAIALFLGSFPFSTVMPRIAQAFGRDWSPLAMRVWDASTGILALCIVLLVSVYLAVDVRERRIVEISPPMVASVALVNFFIDLLVSGRSFEFAMLGRGGVLSAIVVAIASAELLFYFMRFRILRFGRKAYYLDPNIHLSVHAIGPALATVAVFVLVCVLTSTISIDLSQWISTRLHALNAHFDSSLPGLLVYEVLNQLLWFVGIHGPHALENVHQSLFTATDGVITAVSVPRNLLNLYVNIGGSGSTLGLMLALFIFVRRGDEKRVARYALFPSLFNINELVIFGLPIVLNPVYLIPFVLAPLVHVVTSYLFIRHGFVMMNVVKVPWITPAILSGTLNTASWTGGALQLFSIVTSTLIYAPFVRYSERLRSIQKLNDVRRLVGEIERIQLQHHGVLNRHDDIGHTARKLLYEFLQDIDTERVQLAYQPQHDSRGQIVGVEALLRWKHRHYGMIAPAVVCALLEESHQIDQLGRWTIATACRQLRDWKGKGVLGLRMSVNLSPLQLQDAGLLPHIRKCLEENQLPAPDLALELTESQHVPSDPVSVQSLQGIQAMGVHLEMDDFGMGYSSMLYIQRFRFNAIKLDGSLTRDVLKDNNCTDIIRSVVQLARALDMRIIAEYVETPEQQAVLQQLGCDAFQGYLFSPALYAAHCLPYLLEHAPAAPCGDSARDGGAKRTDRELCAGTAM